jgi:short chain dehydrogenase
MNVSKAVLITGCSSGIGWATAERLGDVGWRVYATARNVEKIAPLEQRGCELLPLDVTDEDSMISAIDEVERREGRSGCSSTTPVTASPGPWRLCRCRRSGSNSRRTFSGWRGCASIRTDFADTAVGSMDGPDGENPYAGFDEAVARATADNYERGPISRLGGGPEAVAEAIEQAVSARKPRSRYAVTPSAHPFMRLRRLLPDRAWEALLRAGPYYQPGRKSRR